METMKVRQHYFLTNSYGEGVNEFNVYKEFTLKFILDRGHIDEPINQFRNKLKEKHGVSIPGILLESILKNISKEYEEIVLKEDKIKVKSAPVVLKAHHEKFREEFNSDTRVVVNSFNSYLKENGFKDEASISYIQSTLEKLQGIIINKGSIPIGSVEEKEKIFYEWVHKIIGSDGSANELLFQTLNKLLYSLVVYYYYCFLKIPNSNLTNITPIFDTNVLAFLFGVSGDIKKEFIYELIDLIKASKIKVIISQETIHELGDLITNGTDEQILLFKADNPDLSAQLSLNTRAQVEHKLKEIVFPCVIDEKSISTNKYYTEKWDYLKDSLSKYKKEKRPQKKYSNFSFEHDINLLCIADAYRVTSNIYDHKKPIITFDFLFVKWFEKISKEEFRNTYVPVIPLDQFVLFLAFEGSSTLPSSFLPMTWMYIIDKIPFFKIESANNVFKVLSNLDQKQSSLDNWRSTYLLVKNKILKEKDVRISEITGVQLLEKMRGMGEDLSIAETKIGKLEKSLKHAQKEISHLNRKVSDGENNKRNNKELSTFQRFLIFIGKILKGIFS
ncbi:hypothetical protein [Leptospira santarosai]|uniref:hypothetical protein n=1 Tax=Leptospira santarosai TaxID=28183 RepID=UPI0007745D6D|nr:hypothetical protein [Leptospira santarosai]